MPDYDTSEISLERKKVRLCNLNLSEEMLPWYARKFSKFHSILRLVPWVLRFINNVRSRISDRKKGQSSLDELESAEIQLIRYVQDQSFTVEKLISNLSVFRDDNNIIRVKTRITERIDAPNFLSSILLPNNCIFTQRLVEPFHLKNLHAGTQLLLSIIREKYWIIGGRRSVRKKWNVRVKCRRFKSKSPMTDPVSLPSDRVKDAAVFEVVSVDLAGPLYVKRFPFEIPTADTKDIDVRDANYFRKRLRFRAKVIEELKRRFRNEYLGQLIQRQKQHPQPSNNQVCDIVLIARVINLIPGKDGLVRTVKLKTQSCTLIRPIQRVFPLEASGNDITNPPLHKVQQTDSTVSCPNTDTSKAVKDVVGHFLTDPPQPPVQILLPDPSVVETLEPTLTVDSSIDQIMSSVFGDCSQQGILVLPAHTQEPQLLDTVPSLFDESNDPISFLHHFETGLAIEQQETPMDLTMPRLEKNVRNTTGFKVIEPLDLSVHNCCSSSM
ncbi:integrase catalytic domain-containing protein [Trichonephila clavipes]|uniref:Integrase catalytic domain-containing protein n=1 Tax=Trichonephila clavipes TaxID=2585209 RepID=A0A8X6VJR0_TRICX|nr:integrase catalytic domain-containing protein [Trichonephila clavipes]